MSNPKKKLDVPSKIPNLGHLSLVSLSPCTHSRLGTGRIRKGEGPLKDIARTKGLLSRNPRFEILILRPTQKKPVANRHVFYCVVDFILR